MFDLVSSLRCQPLVKSTASVPLNNLDVQQESALCSTAADAVKFVHGSSLRTAARHSHATTPRDSSATLEEELILVGASVEVHCVLFCLLTDTTLTCWHFPFQTPLLSLQQPNLMGELVSTTTRFTRMGKPSDRTANTSALAWTVLLDVYLCAHMSSDCLNWAVPSPGWWRYRVCAVNYSPAQRRPRQRAMWWKIIDHPEMTSQTRMNWSGEENRSL